jgi:hypothetical protein
MQRIKIRWDGNINRMRKEKYAVETQTRETWKIIPLTARLNGRWKVNGSV